jgi:hypothetical protein
MSGHADDDVIESITASAGQGFFSSVPDGVFNLFSSFTVLDDYEKLHKVLHKNKHCEVHWQSNLRKYAHRAEPLFDVFET